MNRLAKNSTTAAICSFICIDYIKRKNYKKKQNRTFLHIICAFSRYVPKKERRKKEKKKN